MGANYSNFDNKSLENFIKHEYDICKKKSKDYLVLSDLLNVDLPDEQKFNYMHLGTLFMMDTNKDGRFTLDDLQNFGRMSMDQIKSKRFKQHELNQQLQAHCTLKMWETVCGSESKEDDFVAWISRLMKEDHPLAQFKQSPDISFVRQQSIKLLYEVLHVRETHKIEFQQFFALMQQAGEEMEYMSVQDEQQDNYVALPVVQTFAKNFIQGFSKLMTEIGFVQ